ncbi:hypothetical protein QBC35DRAFT_235804 [Podospora australis]|uniref:Uncharacterized protein n=1 Tax=Podospora australis TaxID=1536484 RepID=A0AAN6WTN2_9PEZI|nr:hypothetical protein QBC35DRAFT_235804 [Podospora australis]
MHNHTLFDPRFFTLAQCKFFTTLYHDPLIQEQLVANTRALSHHLALGAWSAHTPQGKKETKRHVTGHAPPRSGTMAEAISPLSPTTGVRSSLVITGSTRVLDMGYKIARLTPTKIIEEARHLQRRCRGFIMKFFDLSDGSRHTCMSFGIAGCGLKLHPLGETRLTHKTRDTSYRLSGEYRPGIFSRVTHHIPSSLYLPHLLRLGTLR